MLYLLFSMTDSHLDTELLMNMLGKMLGRIDTTVLTACTAEAEHQRGEASLNISVHMMVGKAINTIEEGQYLAIILQESDDWLVETRQFLVWLVSAGVMGAATIEDITASIA